MRRAAAIAVSAVSLAGCTTTVSGSVATTTAPATGGVDITLLEPGNYPTRPGPPLGKAGDTEKGAWLEAHRMAGYVMGPWELDPKLSTGVGQIVTKPESFDDDGTGVGEPATAHHFVTGFSSSRADDSGPGDMPDKRLRSLGNRVWRFASPDDAGAAAPEMADRAADTTEAGSDEPLPYDPLPIPGHPDSIGKIRFSDVLKAWTVQAFTVHGPYVLIQRATSKAGVDDAAALITDALDKQVPLIDRFQPTPVDALAALPIDPEGLLARTLPRPPDDPLRYGADGVYDAHSQLHFDGAPARTKGVFDDAGLQTVAVGRANVYQTPDAASAAKIVDGFTAEMTDGGYVPAPGVTGLPDAKCLTRKGHDIVFYCVAVADRYTIEVSASQERDVHQRVAAQYLMLTAT